jgi:hypothetical protein
MLELHMVIAAIVIFNILELIIEIILNYPTDIISVMYAYAAEASKQS